MLTFIALLLNIVFMIRLVCNRLFYEQIRFLLFALKGLLMTVYVKIMCRPASVKLSTDKAEIYFWDKSGIVKIDVKPTGYHKATGKLTGADYTKDLRFLFSWEQAPPVCSFDEDVEVFDDNGSYLVNCNKSS